MVSNRVYQIDGIKGIFIFLVVLGHLIGGGSATSPLGLIHYFIYSVHMPMFILITGLLSKKETKLKRIISDYVIPYGIFDFVYVVYGSIIGQPVNYNILIPSFAYWYILCIAIMKLLYSNLRSDVILVGSVAFSILVAFLVPEATWRWLSIGRVMLLFPAFSIGTLLRGEQLKNLCKHKMTCIVFGVIAVMILYLLLWVGVTSADWATHDYFETIQQLFIKYIYMLLTIAIFMCLFCIIPESSILQKWGQNSIIIYLIHPFIVPLVRYIVYRVTNSEFEILAYMVISALIITMVLSVDLFKRTYDLLIRRLKIILNLEV